VRLITAVRENDMTSAFNVSAISLETLSPQFYFLSFTFKVK